MLVGTAPVIAVGLEAFRGQRPVRQQLLGALAAVVGLVMFLRPGSGISGARAFGYVFALGAAAGPVAVVEPGGPVDHGRLEVEDRFAATGRRRVGARSAVAGSAVAERRNRPSPGRPGGAAKAA